MSLHDYNPIAHCAINELSQDSLPQYTKKSNYSRVGASLSSIRDFMFKTALTGGTVLSIWNAQLAARSPQRLPEPFLRLRIPGAFLNQMVLGFTVGTPHARLDPRSLQCGGY